MVALGALKPGLRETIGKGVEFLDGTPVAGHSAAFDRLRVIRVTLDEIRCSSARRVRNPRLAFQQI
jgi:hypothetical protein